jgi:hypothetical protein
MVLDAPIIHGPEFPPATWINTLLPLSLQGLRGRVVLVDIWDFT